VYKHILFTFLTLADNLSSCPFYNCLQ